MTFLYWGTPHTPLEKYQSLRNTSEMNAQHNVSIREGEMELLTKQIQTCILREYLQQIKTHCLSMAHTFH